MKTLYETWNLWGPDQKEKMLEKTKIWLVMADSDTSDEAVEKDAIETVNNIFWQNFLDNTHFNRDVFNRPCIISGVEEYKDKKYSIVNKKEDTLIEAINKVICDRDYTDRGFYEDENGDLLISIHHQEGIDTYRITFADDKPINWLDTVYGRKLRGEIIYDF